MAFPRPPGVYFERSDAPTWAVDEARSDVAGFVGITERGPLHRPVRVQSLSQFSTRFGRGRRDYAVLPDAVRGFFANGGQTAWIVRVGVPIDPFEHASVFLVDEDDQPLFRVWAKDPGLGGAAISIRITPAVRNGFHLAVVADVDGNIRETLEVWRDLSANPYLPLPAEAAEPPRSNDRYVARVINGWNSSIPPVTRKPDASNESGSALIVIEEISRSTTNTRSTTNNRRRVVGVRPPKPLQKQGEKAQPIVTLPESRLTWGDVNESWASGSRHSVLHGLSREHFVGDELHKWGLTALEEVDDVAIVAIPDLMWWSVPLQPVTTRRRPCDPNQLPDLPAEPSEERIALPDADQQWCQLKTLTHCAHMHNRFAILDARRDSDPVRVENWVKQLHSADGQFGALYFPWIGVSDSSAGVRWLPPSGHMAGLYARVDLGSGVQKSPANEVLTEVQNVLVEVNEETHGQLNLIGVNVLKANGSRGVRAMGARTLIDSHDSRLQQWRFVSVRRLLLMLEKSLQRSAFSLVQTDNRPERWRDVERVIRNFLRRQWQMGRLGGTTPEEAFSVECNESTNPWEDVQRGRMTCMIGVQPPLPAEFVFVRLGSQGGDAGMWSLEGES